MIVQNKQTQQNYVYDWDRESFCYSLSALTYQVVKNCKLKIIIFNELCKYLETSYRVIVSV